MKLKERGRAMVFDPTQLDEIVKRMGAALPEGVRQFQGEMEKQMKSVLQAAFSRMDLVTREEFDAQAAVLAKARQQLDALEEKVAALETGQATEGKE